MSNYRLLCHLSRAHRVVERSLLAMADILSHPQTEPAAARAPEEVLESEVVVERKEVVETKEVVELNEVVETKEEVEEAVEARAGPAGRPFPCPVCGGWFRLRQMLQQHLAKMHLWAALLRLPVRREVAGVASHLCSVAGCSYRHANPIIIAGHIAVSHKTVFEMTALKFPNWRLPEEVVVELDDEVTILEEARPPAAAGPLQGRALPLQRPLHAPLPPRPLQPPGPAALPVAWVRPSARPAPAPLEVDELKSTPEHSVHVPSHTLK